MDKFKLRNKGKEIGTVSYKVNNIKKLSKNQYKFIVSTLLVGGIAVSMLAHGNKDKGEEVVSEEVTMEESLVPSNELFRADLFEIDKTEEDGTILFVDSDYLNKNNYIPLDNIDTRYDFIVSFNDEVHKENKYPDLDLTEFDEYYKMFRMVYEEYIDGDQKDSISQKEYILELEKRIIEIIHSFNKISYIPNAVSYDEYLLTTIPNEGEKKYTVEYEIPKDSTLSEILSYTDNNEEYKISKEEVLANPNNKIDNEDLIYAGATLTLPNLDEGDLTDMGYTLEITPTDELNQRHEWINAELDEIDILSGDDISKANLESLKYSINKFNEAYDAYMNGDTYVDTEIVYDARQICNSIFLLTGHQYEIQPVRVR